MNIRSVIGIFPTYRRRKIKPGLMGLLTVSLCFIDPGITRIGAQEISTDQARSGPANQVEDQLVVYPVSYFARYRPTTALDMVQQIPGFQVDNGDSNRGFGNTIGNILINDNYPSAKQDRPTSTLDRIPASQVERIELIRGQVRGIDLLGHALVANIILRDNQPASVGWLLYFDHNNHGPVKPGANISLTSKWAGFEYLAGLKVEREASGEVGTENVLDENRVLTEIRNDDRAMTGLRVTGNLSASKLIGETLTQLNTNYMYRSNNTMLISQRVPQMTVGEQRTDSVESRTVLQFIEFGMDAERKLTNDLVGKAIFLLFYQEVPLLAKRQSVDAGGNQSEPRIADSLPVSTESIARLEFDWSVLSNHKFQVNLEGAYNSLENLLAETRNDIMSIEKTRVEEMRGDFQIKDTWSIGDLELDFGIGAETSTISQSGEVNQERSFSFIKPEVVLTYSPDQVQQTRLRLAREVSQLNFGDFASVAILEDDDVVPGNPNLRPETTWISEIGHEVRFGQDSVVGVTAFHHWITDVEDILPLTDTFEVAGNIGDGTRWGVELESTVSMEWLGWAGVKFDIKARWQDSSVTDPVTGNDRVLSAVGAFAGPPTFKFNSENEYTFDIAFRQDLEAAQVAWGWDVARHANRPLFRVDALDLFHEGTYLRAFVETSRWAGIKIRFSGSNILDYNETREQTFYDGRRDITPINFILQRSRKPGRRLRITVSGNF